MSTYDPPDTIGMGVYAYACPPPQPAGRVAPNVVITEISAGVPKLVLYPVAGLIKLKERLKAALRDSDAKLDMDEVGAMVWLESLR